VLFACVLPSTVQSSIALTSIAQGNVAGAICAATASNLAGIVLTPILFTALARMHGGATNISGIGQIVLQLLVPFLLGHLLRPAIGSWAERNRPILAITDRGSILIVVYTSFSAAVVHGIWHQVPVRSMESLGAIVASLLAIALLTTIAATRTAGLAKADEVAVVFCGSQKSLVSGVPIASALFSGPAAGVMLLPIMLYYPMQLLVGAGLARWYAARTD
jgi:sodium/bile acid cotransporter 7